MNQQSKIKPVKIRAKKYKPLKVKKYKKGKEEVVSGQGLGRIPKDFIPEVKVRYTRGKQFLGTIKESGDVADFIRKTYGQGKVQLQEAFIVLFLNNSLEIIGYYKHSIGGITQTLVDVRIIFAVALKSLATGIILAHNHPSGSLKPSDADLQMTKKFEAAGEILQVKVYDHVIITKDQYTSFSDIGLI
jgi:DNA repair protein RadC